MKSTAKSQHKEGAIMEENVNKFPYQMLGRLKQDCEYFLGNGGGHEKHLWALSVEDHIAEMKKIWHSFSVNEKPEWLSLDEINTYEQKMLELKKR